MDKITEKKKKKKGIGNKNHQNIFVGYRQMIKHWNHTIGLPFTLPCHRVNPRAIHKKQSMETIDITIYLFLPLIGNKSCM